MGKGYRFFDNFALGLALACAVLASHPAYADQFTLSGPSSITLTEGDSSSPQTFTFTNNSGGDVTIQAIGHSLAPPSPDPTDIAGIIVSRSGGTTPCILTSIIANGNSCTFEVTWTTDSSAGETDHDSGTTSEKITLHTSGGSASSSVPVTVNDPPPSTVPEPASVVLLGSSLLGALGLLRRKLL